MQAGARLAVGLRGDCADVAGQVTKRALSGRRSVASVASVASVPPAPLCRGLRVCSLWTPRRRWLVALSVMLASLLLLAGVGEAAARSARGVPQIMVLSNRADLVSGGDALVEIRLPAGTRTKDVRATLNGRDITASFAVRPNGRFQGLVDGLRLGRNRLVASLRWRRTQAKQRTRARATRHTGTVRRRPSSAVLTVTNRSLRGPIFAGTQVLPWICETEKFGLGPARGPDCVAPTKIEFFYKPAHSVQRVVGGDPVELPPGSNAFEPYDPKKPPPDALIAKTTTDQGKTVPYIVRRERGVIDRGIYDIAVLFDPEERWNPWAPQGAWNGKLHFVFRGGGGTMRRQGGTYGVPNVMDGQWLEDLPLSRGFAVASSSLLATANNPNDVVAAESAMMVKEHFIETYGPVRYTTSDGSSGASMLQRLVAANYPGLLDGIMPLFSFPDFWSMVSGFFTDCPLLARYFNETSPQLWLDPSDRRAVQGLGAADCEGVAPDTLNQTFLNPEVTCAVPASAAPAAQTASEPEWVYHHEANPTGERCTTQDYQAPMFGYRKAESWGPIERKIGRGFANRPVDSVGVQYGLLALLHGNISAEQFVDLNAKIGGRGIDYNWTPERSEADIAGLRNAYRSGRIPDYRQLAKVPMLEVRGAFGDAAHASIYSQSARARLIAANGNAENYVSWVMAPGWPGTVQEVFDKAFLLLDRWMTNIEADGSDAPLETKVVRNKPSQAKDTCWAAGQPGACGDSLPDFPDPRMVAGGSVASDILKCQLKPIDWDDYGSIEFTEEQRQQLREAFPDGVCDWTKPGVEQQPPGGVWQSFATTTGGAPLGPPPRSAPIHGAR